MMESLKKFLLKLFRSEEGQDLTEYALLVALIAVVVLVAVVIFGTNVSSFFSGLASYVGTWLGFIPP